MQMIVCLLAPIASAMQTSLDVCYDILCSLIKSVCTVFKPNVYELYRSKVFIGSDALKFVRNLCTYRNYL